jgi:lysozyme
MHQWFEDEVEELKLDEGFRSKPYKDSLGYWTIGYGHHDGVTADTAPINKEDAESLLIERMEEAWDDAKIVVPSFDQLDGPRKGAVLNLAYNLGRKKLAGFHGTLQAIEDQDWDEVERRLLNSLYARQVKGRANRIAYRLKTGDYAER